MQCGQAIIIRDPFGSYACRFIAMCEGRFLMITNALTPGNGNLLPDWHYVLREIIPYAVPAKMVEKLHQVDSTAQGRYLGFPLSYPLRVSALADLLEVDAADMRAELDDIGVNRA